MSKNDQVILEEILKQQHAEVDPSSKDHEFFEMFTAGQILKDFDLSYDEIESGLTGGGNDGGIDGLFVLVNGELVPEDPDYQHLKKNIELDLVVIQAKTAATFKETPIERFITAADDILDLSTDPRSMRDVYNREILDVISRFRDVHKQLAVKFPKMRISFYYASKGLQPDKKLNRKVAKLKDVVLGHFPQAEFDFQFLGAAKLLELARRTPQVSYVLAVADTPISSGVSGDRVAFACLVHLSDFFAFITDEDGGLRRGIFEANVRDYQGRTAVNDDIQETLTDTVGLEDFWWLNNGVTIVATQASQSGKSLTIEDPQIVNGLQTSQEVFNYFSTSGGGPDDRRILVRVIVPTDPASRYKIIKATNSQTSVQHASLRATDKVHRDIEQYLKPRGLYYDRRKNFYKNAGKPRDKIVSIPHLAQAVMSMALLRPDTARARPSSLLKKDEDYAKVFTEDYPIELYYVCAETMRRVETRLRTNSGLSVRERNNLKFYVALLAVHTIRGDGKLSTAELACLDPAEIDDTAIDSSLAAVKLEYDGLGADDQVAKGTELRARVIAMLA